jgi:hypothetical protein
LYKLTAWPAGMLQRGLRRTLEDLRQHAKAEHLDHPL